jgi:transcriptional regulator with XRE-family HTH domain
MKVRYLVSVAERRSVDRTAWAVLVESWRVNSAGGNQTTLAKMLDVTPRTVSRWLREEVDVSEDNVRSAAEVFGRRPLELLVQVGFYTAEEVMGAAANLPNTQPRSDEADELERDIARILADNSLPPGLREDVARMGHEMQREYLAERKHLAEQQRNQARRRLADVLRIARRGTQPTEG